MGWKDFFSSKKKKKEEPLSLDNLTLSKLKVGYFVDYDLQTWEVVGYHYYDWGHGDITHEWQLKSHDDTIYLECESDDENVWSIGKKISFSRLGPGIADHIIKNGDPPDEIKYDGVTYYLEEMSGGHFYENGKGPGQKFLSWDYEDDDGEKFLSIEQWGERDFEAGTGFPVEEYQFTNILPRETTG